MKLTKKQLDVFRERLIQLKNQYQAALKGVSEGVKAYEGTSAHSQHQADQGTDDFDTTITIGVGSKEVQVLYQIERALEKIDEGTYGICDMTEEAIPIKRLEAIPYATMTVQAQEKLERGEIE